MLLFTKTAYHLKCGAGCKIHTCVTSTNYVWKLQYL